MIELAVNQFITALLVSIRVSQICSENKKACKHLIYRPLVVFNFVIGGMDGTRTRDPMRDRHVF
jgi:hypothetical protein